MEDMKPLAEMGRYATVVIDPPWPLPNFGISPDANSGLSNPMPYSLMTVEDIAALPIAEILLPDARLFCWCINRFMPDVYLLLARWGLKYNFTFTWVKNGGIQAPGTPMLNSEWCVIGKRGAPKWNELTGFRIANYWPRGRHSEKPEGFYDLLRRVTPGPRLDVFGRRRIAGFDSWGNEAPEGLALPDHYQQVLVG